MWLRRILLIVLLLALAAQGVVIGYLLKRARWQADAEATPVSRGRAIAERWGCFGCHGPEGLAPIPNPGSRTGGVPAWAGGTWMMWNESEEDIRSWIVDGHAPGHPADKKALIPMPAYGERLTPGQVDDLVAYVLAASQFGWREDPLVAEGQEVAIELGCFGCHGPEGRGLIRNPGSFKGYVPAWDGDDFLELCRDEEEFRQWVRNGISDRFRRNPAASRFLETQAVPMPPYGDEVTDEQLDALWAYVQWIRANPRSATEKGAP